MQWKYTALHWAAAYGHLQLVQLLLNKEADVDAKENVSFQYSLLTHKSF